ncbi:MAG: SusD/RagB family nutrient-binding outer membrane lipoprotein [Salinivirgaceae bacterium]|nr:SusD/RagB family nutrient-binding outer membrane lipoprotein [Salinivirgaceae bacterium]
MKKNLSKIVLIVFGLFAVACSEDKMDEINTNKNNPTDMASRFILTDVMTSTAFSIVGANLAFYASCYIEYNVGIYNQLYLAEIRGAQADMSSTYNNEWSQIYQNLSNLKVCIEKCSEGGEEAENYYGLGVAQVLSAYNLAVLTDLFGDVPWTEALQPGVIYTPKLDSQESIYEVIFGYLDSAIDNFGKDCQYDLDNQDFYYGGDIELWTKFAYGLKARYTMRLMGRASDKNAEMNKVIEYANNSFESADEEAKFALYDGVVATSPFYQFMIDRDYLGASASFDELLLSLNDPRELIYYVENPNTGDFVVAENGKPLQQQGYYAISGISTKTAPTYLLSYHEIEFLKAEAYARLGDVDKTKEACEKAITAACKKVNVAVPDSLMNPYVKDVIANIKASNALTEVATQKYIAFYEEEAVEAYNDIRRWKSLGEEHIVLAHPNPDKFPLRYAYGGDDVTTNTNVYEAFSNTDVYKDNVWWAGGDH